MESKKWYVFILGRYPKLSLKELDTVLKNDKTLSYSIESDSHVALVKTKKDLDVVKLNKKLGGIVKMGIVIDTLTLPQTSEQLTGYLSSDKTLITFFGEQKKRVNYGISLYSLNTDENYLKQLKNNLSFFLKTIKKRFDQLGVKSHFPSHKDQYLKSASVVKNKLLAQGAELLFIVTSHQLLIGKTLAVQEFEEFSNRDYKRPFKDLKSGIMPPKLARMMINLSGANTSQSILDPFCGSGTIIQEALLLGYTNIYGRDVSQKAVADTKNNLLWLRSQFYDVKTSVQLDVCDVRNLSIRFKKNAFDAVITEPFLGPNFKNRPRFEEALQIKTDLEKLYLASFRQFHSVLNKNGVVVMVFPVFNTPSGHVYLDILLDIERLGFSQIELNQNNRKSITAGNNLDFVSREIVEWKKE